MLAAAKASAWQRFPNMTGLLSIISYLFFFMLHAYKRASPCRPEHRIVHHTIING